MIHPRVIIVGDVHGCIQELRSLLDYLKPRPGQDRLIFVGDLVNRGPDSHAVVELARQLRAESTLGNHEARLLRYRQDGDGSQLKPYDRATLEQLQAADWAYLEQMVLTIQLPEYDALIVHGGFLPHIPWQQQGADIITRIQVIDERGQPAKRSEAPNGTPWENRWDGPPFVIYGHTPRPQVVERRSSIGIDTGCVYGGRLTAYVLPERTLYQVSARRSYAPKGKAFTNGS